MGKSGKLLFNGWELAGNEHMDRRFMFMKTINPGWGLSAKFIGIYPRSKVSVYRYFGPLFFLSYLNMSRRCLCVYHIEIKTTLS